jgi:hypothetical protein
MTKVSLSNLLLASVISWLLGCVLADGDHIRGATYAYYILAVAAMLGEVKWAK